jgi:hypothetical protein
MVEVLHNQHFNYLFLGGISVPVIYLVILFREKSFFATIGISSDNVIFVASIHRVYNISCKKKMEYHQIAKRSEV